MTKSTEPARCWWRDGVPACECSPKVIAFPAPLEPAPDGCPARDALELHALGRLGAAEAQWIDEHLWLCERCSEFHDLDQQFIAALRKAKAPAARTAAAGAAG